MILLNILNEKVKDAFIKAGYNVEGNIVRLSDRPDLSQFQCNTALNKAKEFKLNPRVIAENVVKILKEDEIFESVTVEGPGFINIIVKNKFLADHVEDNFSELNLSKYNNEKKKIIIDYGGPNVAKPLHVGHLRPAIIGEGLKRLAKELGNDIIGDVHLGDWGRQMGLVISEIKHRKPELVYFDDNYQGEYPNESPVTVEDLNEIYPTANAKAKEDEQRMEEARETTAILQNEEKKGHKGYYELWKQLVRVSVEDLKKTYDKLNVHFDLWKGESDCNKSIPELINCLKEKGLIEISEGATVVNVKEYTDKTEMPPVIIKTKNNTVGYQATDLATIYERMKEYNPDEIWYVVDGRQKLHFEQIFRVCYKSEIVDKDKKLIFIGFGTMNGKDGKPFKTRDGGVMKLSELISLTEEKAMQKMKDTGLSQKEKEEISKIIADASIKYADAISNRSTDYIFDIDKFTDNTGKNGPYILYSAVRIKSLLKKAKEQGLKDGNLVSPATKEELDILLEIEKLPNVILEAYNNKSLSEIANYLFTLDSAFNNLYNNCRILEEADKEKQESLLKLIKIVGNINEKLLNIMAIRIPEKM